MPGSTPRPVTSVGPDPVGDSVGHPTAAGSAGPDTPRRDTPRPDQADQHAVPSTATPSTAAPAPDAAAMRVPGETSDLPGPPLAGDGIDPVERTPRSFHLSRGVLERARAAAYWVAQRPAVGEPTNVSELVERALRREVERLERQYNDGLPFPAVVGRMRTGPGASGVERIRRAQQARRRTR